MQAAIKDLQDAVVVMAHIEKQQSEHIRDLRQFQHRTEQNLAQITARLNGLIGCVAGQRGHSNNRPADLTDIAGFLLILVGSWYAVRPTRT